MRLLRFILCILLGPAFGGFASELKLLNVSYDTTRELFGEVNAKFAQEWERKTGQRLIVRQSHGGSGRQTRAVMDGLRADVVSLALAYDVNILAEMGRLLPTNWQSRLPNNSAPFTSTIVFLVRKGNPKAIRDWDDLVRPGIKVITPNPRTSGGARWAYLAAWGFATRKLGCDHRRALEFMTRLFENVPVLDSGARGAATTFVQREIGDVLIAWENEALLSMRESQGTGIEIVTPSLSILAEPVVAWVDQIVKKRNTTELARAYLEYLYTPEGQLAGAKNFFRPRSPEAAARFPNRFPAMELFTIDEAFGGWKQAHAAHFAEGGTFEQVQRAHL